MSNYHMGVLSIFGQVWNAWHVVLHAKDAGHLRFQLVVGQSLGVALCSLTSKHIGIVRIRRIG
jgi:hypothetical protein